MIEVRAQLTIHQPADRVWSFAAEIARHPDWMSVTSAESLQGTGTQVGDRGRERMRLGPWASYAELTVVAADPGRRIAWRPGRARPSPATLFWSSSASGRRRHGRPAEGLSVFVGFS